MDFLGIGFAEFLFIMVIALMVFGPRRLPEIAAKAGKIVADLRNMSRGIMIEWQREINFAADLDEELKKTRQELTGVKNDLIQTKQAVLKDTTEVANAIAPPALAAQVAPTPATPPTPDSPEPASSPTTSDNAEPSDAADIAPADAESDSPADTDTPIDADTPTDAPPSQTSVEAKSSPAKTVPAAVPRPPATAKNGAVDASTQTPEQNSEKTVDEQ
jgi:sec-independent protein translocase protein TatB